MKNYFYINFILLLFCFNKFFFGTNNDNEFFPDFTYDNVKDYVKDGETFNEAKKMLKHYLHINDLIVQREIIYKKTQHNMYKCINCFTTINKKIYGIRFYKNGKIEIGSFTSLLKNYICQNGYLWNTQKWIDIEKKTIIEMIKQTPEGIVKIGKNVVSTGKFAQKGIKTIRELAKVVTENEEKIKKIKENLKVEGTNLSEMVNNGINNMLSLTENKQVVKNFTKEGIEKTMMNANKMNNVLDMCSCCQFCLAE